MLTTSRDEILHKVWLYRILTAIVDSPRLAKTFRFKGGTCAAMRGMVDRLSVGLDFDLIAFIKEHVTQRIINQDLSPILPLKEFRSIRNNLRTETLMPLETELNRVLKMEE